MGLDITAYKNVTFNVAVENEDDEIIVFNDYAEHYPLQLGSLVNKTFREYNSETFEDSHEFRAGSYSGYNEFRNWICEKANGISAENVWTSIGGGYSSEASFIFGYLINFSDYEGFICKEIAEILYHEFVDNKDKILSNTPNKEYWHDVYFDWIIAFDYARQNGFISFH